MIAVALLRWWYGAGWVRQVRLLMRRVDNVAGFFSVELLARTLFDPFRQIGAGSVRGSLQVQFQAWLDRLFSRFVGFFVRSTMIFIGLLSIVGVMLVGLATLAIWPILPILPIIGAIVAATGWIL